MIFEKDYNKSEFYSIMGKFFAERHYRKLMPYLANDEKTTWMVKVDRSNNVLGFISYIEKDNKINIGYCYAEDMKNKEKVESEIFMKFFNDHVSKAMFIEIEKSFSIDMYLEFGFKVYKETTNYWFLEREAPYEII